MGIKDKTNELSDTEAEKVAGGYIDWDKMNKYIGRKAQLTWGPFGMWPGAYVVYVIIKSTEDNQRYVIVEPASESEAEFLGEWCYNHGEWGKWYNTESLLNYAEVIGPNTYKIDYKKKNVFLNVE